MLQIASLVPAGARLIDVGTDHSWLPILLVERGAIASAIAADVRLEPLSAARRNIAGKGLTDRISVRLGSGLSVVAPGEVDTAVIAGMGGPLIVDILQESPQVVEGLSTLILQPMIASGRVRKHLDDCGWSLQTEQVFRDQGRFYELIQAVHTQGGTGDDPYRAYRDEEACLAAAYDYGPTLLAKPDLAFIEWMQENLARLRSTLSSLANAEENRARDRRTAVAARAQWIEAWLKGVKDNGQADHSA